MTDRFASKLGFGKRLALCAAAAAIVSPLAVFVARAQQPPELQFEVASIKPTEFPSDAYAAGFRAGAAASPCGGSSLSVSGTFVSVTKASICSIVRIAYDVRDYQVTGIPAALSISGEDKAAPAFVDAQIATESKRPPAFYDIQARASGPNPPTAEQARQMLQSLLRDRFHISLHRENRELPFYALVPAKDGPKLSPAADGCKPAPIASETMHVCGQTMESLARYLKTYTDRPVMDMTGIATKFDFEIPIDRSNFGESVLTGVQRYLKLKLEPRKGPVEVLVVDHVERPSEN